MYREPFIFICFQFNDRASCMLCIRLACTNSDVKVEVTVSYLSVMRKDMRILIMDTLWSSGDLSICLSICLSIALSISVSNIIYRGVLSEFSAWDASRTADWRSTISDPGNTGRHLQIRSACSITHSSRVVHSGFVIVSLCSGSADRLMNKPGDIHMNWMGPDLTEQALLAAYGLTNSGKRLWTRACTLWMFDRVLKNECASLLLSKHLKSVHLGSQLRFRLPHLLNPKQCLPNTDTHHSPHQPRSFSLSLSVSLQALLLFLSSSIHSSVVLPYISTFFSSFLVSAAKSPCEKLLPGHIFHMRSKYPQSIPYPIFRPHNHEVSLP